MSTLRRCLGGAAWLAFAVVLTPACAPILGLEDPGQGLDQICSCTEFGQEGELLRACEDAAALPAHQTKAFLDAYVATDANGVSCPDCQHLHACLTRLEVDERYIPCNNAVECAGDKCCAYVDPNQASCCADCPC